MGEAMTVRVEVAPELLRWARERAAKNLDELVGRFPKYPEWESGGVCPTLKQLETFANFVHAPVGYFFLSEPPDEPFPIPDFRTAGDQPHRRPSPDLLDTIYLCQQRQDWYREFARMEGDEPLSFVGSANLSEDVKMVAARIRSALHLDLEERRALPTWTEALRRFVEMAETLGVLVMVSGVVRNNTHRRLDPDEFRGFALVDDLAPLIFVNGSDSKAAQMFTLAHELAHLWRGESALSNSSPYSVPEHAVEAWCNRVAAELLVPLDALREEYRQDEELAYALSHLARRFKVSTLVILRRIHDSGELTRHEFHSAYDAELKKLATIPRGSGGDFYRTHSARVGDQFTRAVIADTLEGGTSFTEAFRLLGFKKMRTFNELARRHGILV